MKIIDCFIFYNELELLTYRLNILNDVVDYFVLVESTHTHIGKEKELIYEKNKNLFEQFKDKIIHVIVDDFQYKLPNTNFPNGYQWQNENHQRNCIDRGLQKLDLQPEDCIIISDLDEIADPRTLQLIKDGTISVSLNSLEMDLYYYNLNSKIINKWNYSKIILFKKYKELSISTNAIRAYECPKIVNGGWHLSYFGDTTFIKNKIQQFGHQEYNNNEYTDETKIQERINTCSDLFGRWYNSIVNIKLKDNTYLPVQYEKYLTQFLS